jgi:hypothetical protein
MSSCSDGRKQNRVVNLSIERKAFEIVQQVVAFVLVPMSTTSFYRSSVQVPRYLYSSTIVLSTLYALYSLSLSLLY